MKRITICLDTDASDDRIEALVAMMEIAARQPDITNIDVAVDTVKDDQ